MAGEVTTPSFAPGGVEIKIGPALFGQQQFENARSMTSDSNGDCRDNGQGEKDATKA